jgi:hypothetical protein
MSPAQLEASGYPEAADARSSAVISPKANKRKFEVVEATITDIQNAIRSKQITSTDLVNLYLARIKAIHAEKFERVFHQPIS